VRVIVTDNGTPPMSATQQVIIVVNEVNVAPVLDPIANQTNNELTLITFMATATDSDLPGQTLSFSLDGAPAGAVINSGSGVFTWTPIEGKARARIRCELS